MVMVAIERRNANDGGSLLLSNCTDYGDLYLTLKNISSKTNLLM